MELPESRLSRVMAGAWPAWLRMPSGPGLALAGGVAAGLAGACLSWAPALALWPLALLLAVAPRLRLIGLGGLAWALTMIGIAQLGSTARALVISGELQYGEAIIYGQAARLLQGELLYQPIDSLPFTITAYTPLYYWLCAGLRLLFGDGFGPGRMLSALAGIAAVLMVGHIVAQGARNRWAGGFAALLFLGLGMPWVAPRPDLFFAGDVLHTFWANLVADMPVTSPWMAFYKEDMLGVALALAAVLVLQASTGRAGVVTAGALAALAILTKQTLVAPAIAGTLWLLLRVPRQAAIYASVTAGIVGAVGVALEATTGAFVSNTVLGNVNPMRLDVLAATLPVLLRFQAGPIALAAIAAVQLLRGRENRDRLLVFYWLATILPLVGLVKAGSNHNHWTELAASTAILASIGLWRAFGAAETPRPRALVPMALLGGTLLAVMPLFGHPARMQPSWPQPDPAEVEEQQELVELVRSTPGAVLAAQLGLIALADRPILLEPYIYTILEREGRWDSRPLARSICSGEVALLVFEHPLEDGSGEYHGYAFWPAPVLAALQDTMVLHEQRGGYYLYVPRQPGQPSLVDEPPRFCPG